RSFKGWPSQLCMWDKSMNRSRKLNIESPIIFGQHALPVRLLSHLDSRYRIVLFVEIGNLICGILGSSVQHRNRHDGRKPSGNSAVKEEIESDLVPLRNIEISRRMPRINR